MSAALDGYVSSGKLARLARTSAPRPAEPRIITSASICRALDECPGGLARLAAWAGRNGGFGVLRHIAFALGLSVGPHATSTGLAAAISRACR